LSVQFGIAPAANARIEQAVVERPTTYSTGNTIALVVAAITDAIANFVMRLPSNFRTRGCSRSGDRTACSLAV